MTSDGGGGNGGTVFQVNPDGSGYRVLHTFTGGSADGFRPYGALVQSGSTLYGMTNQGGSADSGTVFKIGLDGSGFSIIHTFTGADGLGPHGSLVVSGSTLYGMTQNGGAGSGGTIFNLEADGSAFTVLHSFQRAATDGFGPLGSLLLSGSTLYGMTQLGGSEYGVDSADGDTDPGDGTLFRLLIDGSGYEVMHSFTDSPDGASPYGDLILSDSTLYGMTAFGGDNGYGTVFSFAVPVPEPSSLALLAAGGSLVLFARRRKKRPKVAGQASIAA